VGSPNDLRLIGYDNTNARTRSIASAVRPDAAAPIGQTARQIGRDGNPYSPPAPDTGQ